MLVARLMGGFLIQLAHFIFVLIETSLTFIKLSMVLFYYESTKNFLLLV